MIAKEAIRLAQRFPTAILVVFALAWVGVGSAAAGTVSFDGRVFRYQAQPRVAEKIEVYGTTRSLDAPGLFFLFIAPAPVEYGQGCRPSTVEHNDHGGKATWVLCRLTVRGGQARALRYRVDMGDKPDVVYGPERLIHGVVRGGRGDDKLWETFRGYGGPGHDRIQGRFVDGGPGADTVSGIALTGYHNVVRGGAGNDRVEGQGLLYGGPGNDRLEDWLQTNMLVGGPGHDRVKLLDDGETDIVRLRHGGSDSVECGTYARSLPNNKDVLLVDRTDHVSPSCMGARIMLNGRPPSLLPPPPRP